MRLKEDEEAEQDLPEDNDEEKPATYRGTYVLISNRSDAPDEMLPVYAKRWRIEVFFRRAKQDLGLANCHSITEEHHHAHLELLSAQSRSHNRKSSHHRGYSATTAFSVRNSCS